MERRKRKRWLVVLFVAVAVPVIAIIVGLQIFDQWLLRRVRQEADVFAQKLGRPIEIGGISVRLLGGSAVQVEGVKIGAAPGEELPLATLEDIEVRAALWPLVRSRGKDVQVQLIRVDRPELTVVRLPDGTTNLDHLRTRLDAISAGASGESKTPEPEQDLSGVRVSSFEIKDGRVRLVDRSAGPAREIAINDVDLTLADVRAGQPIELTLAAAVLADKQNLTVSLTSTPLPRTLRPTPDRLQIKSEPIDLSPLVPFLPKDIGFLGGSLAANLTAQLGSAVPGGEGPTHLSGFVRALGLKFRGAEGGKSLDVTLDSDLSGNVVEGNLDLRKLEIALGPAQISGHGKVANLASEQPSVQGLEISARNLDPAILAQYFPALEKMIGGQIAGPIGLSVTASASEKVQAIAYDLDFTQTRVRVANQLTKAAGAPMRMNGTLRGSAKGVYAFDAKVDLQGADLRPGEILNKAPGDRFEIITRGTFQPAATPAAPTRVRASQLQIYLLQDSLDGTASLERKGSGARATTTFELAMKGARVNADRLLLSDDHPQAAKTAAKPAGASREPAHDPDRFDGLRGAIALDIGSLLLKGVQMSNVVVRAKMVDDQISLEQLRAGAYGGTITGDGSKIALGPVKKPFEVKVSTRNIDLGAALARGNSTHKALDGTFNGDFSLKGVGYEIENLEQTLVGGVHGSLVNGSFLGSDLVSAVSEPLAKALPFTSKALKSERVTRLGGELPFGVTIENGVAKLKKPIRIQQPAAELFFDGGILLRGDLNLAGTIALTPKSVFAITGGRAMLKEAIPIAVKLTGPAWKPRLTGIDVKPAVAAIARQAATGVAEKVIGSRLGEKGKAVTEAMKGNTDHLKLEAEQKASEERARAEARAREEAAKARQRAEQEAKKRLQGIFGGR